MNYNHFKFYKTKMFKSSVQKILSKLSPLVEFYSSSCFSMQRIGPDVSEKLREEIEVEPGQVIKAIFDTKEYILHNLVTSPSTKACLSREDALRYYFQMQTIRRMETAAGDLFQSNRIRGYCHVYSGQEACATGILAALRSEDSVITSYRVHGWAFLMGVSVHAILAELLGFQMGCCRGKSGSMHMYAHNFWGGFGIIGSQVPVGTGIALANKYKNLDAVCFVLYGDAASDNGQIFEAFNMAKIWSLPVIFVCENNTNVNKLRSKKVSASSKYFTKGDYISGIKVDGMDILAVREASSYAINHCISGQGPIILDISMYHYGVSSTSDLSPSYRTREEVNEMRRSQDPVMAFKERLISAKLFSPKQLKKIDNTIRMDIDKALKKALADSEASLKDLTTDVYCRIVNSEVRGISPWDKCILQRLGTALNE